MGFREGGAVTRRWDEVMESWGKRVQGTVRWELVRSSGLRIWDWGKVGHSRIWKWRWERKPERR